MSPPRSLLTAALLVGALGAPGFADARDVLAPPTDGDLTVSVRATPLAPATATFVDITVEVTDPTADSYSITISFGDGQVTASSMQVLCAPDGRTRGLDLRVPFRHAYRHAGPAAISVTVETDGCEGEPNQAAAAAAVAVTPGAMPSNGPHPPLLHLADHRHDRTSPRKIVLPLDVGDEDGTLHALRIDWGDKTSTTVGPASCTDPLLTWPSYRRHLEPLHTYARPGRYAIEVAVVSTGCDGQGSQSASARRTVHVAKR